MEPTSQPYYVRLKMTFIAYSITQQSHLLQPDSVRLCLAEQTICCSNLRTKENDE